MTTATALLLELQRKDSRFVTYGQGDDRPLCGLCGPGASGTHKRAVFFDLRAKQALCAKCAAGAHTGGIFV